MQNLILTTNTSSSSISIGKGQLQYLNTYIETGSYESVFCIVDATVYELFGAVIEEGLQSQTCSYNLTITTFESSESNKTLTHIEALLNKVSDSSCTKSTLFVAIGGGVVCDMTGLIAGLWYRGCDVMYVPTTLLSMVDASVGGKCGVDFRGHKNQLGLIIQPKQVVIDPYVLGTLPPEIFRDGCAEIIKHACLASNTMFEMLQEKPLTTNSEVNSSVTYQLQNRVINIPTHLCSYSFDELEALIAQNIEIKSYFVQEDEFDRGVRAALNYGHTVGHAFEAATNMDVSHGTAVARGIVFANSFGVQEGLCDPNFADATLQLLLNHGLLENEKNYADYQQKQHWLNSGLIKDIKSHLTHDKKASGDKAAFIFVEKPGVYDIQRIDIATLNSAIETLF